VTKVRPIRAGGAGPAARRRLRLTGTRRRVHQQWKHTLTEHSNLAHPEAHGGSRRDFLYVTAGAVGAVGVASVAWPLVDQLNPDASVLALASIEFDLSAIEEGQSVTIRWRGLPVFVRHRTAAEIEAARSVPLSELKDPETDEDRTKVGHEQWLIMIANCTHLGCIPEGESGEFGGWRCPCHNSQFDTAGRIRKGPAATNLVVPPYEFVSDTLVQIG
jgi:ubiquinol-cytochrome c reductase iron-sulfur subunit